VAADDHSPKTLNRAGFRRLIDESGKPIKSDSDHMREYGERISAADNEHAQVEYIVLREVFRRELCQGYDADSVAGLLKKRGHLVHERDRLTAKQRLPGIGTAACYQIKPSVFSDEL
jgi:putative DNA primase/helicase